MGRGEGILKPMNVDDILAVVIGKKKASRAQCIGGLWAYIKKHKLQDPSNGRLFTPDQKMAKIFGHKKMNGFRMAKYLVKYQETLLFLLSTSICIVRVLGMSQ